MQEGALAALAAKGLLVAALPLVYVWRSRATDKLRKLAWVTAFLTFDLIVLGGFTRLTDSVSVARIGPVVMVTRIPCLPRIDSRPESAVTSCAHEAGPRTNNGDELRRGNR